MGIFDFVKEAGTSLFGGGKAAEEAKFVEQMEVNAHTAAALKKLILDTGMQIEGLQVRCEQSLVTLKGIAASQAEKEKIVLLAGNTKGISQVDDQMTVARKAPEPEAVFYTVKPGDTLSKIAKEHYGSSGKYMTIFEANTPMLKDPNRIYPGQVLRIPPLQS
jgi:nucleoid-associated protein YgaU